MGSRKQPRRAMVGVPGKMMDNTRVRSEDGEAERGRGGRGGREPGEAVWLADLTAGERSAVGRVLDAVLRAMAERTEADGGMSAAQGSGRVLEAAMRMGAPAAPAVTTAHAGSGTAAADIGHGWRMERDDRGTLLTRREREVLRLAGQGLKWPAIALMLSVSRETVHTHMRRASAKLEVKGTGQAVARARELGLI